MAARRKSTVRMVSLVGELRRMRRQMRKGSDHFYLGWAIDELEDHFAESVVSETRPDSKPVRKDIAELDCIFRLEDPRG